jgi:hypothetical protein
LPSYFHDESDFHSGVGVGTAEAVNHIEFIAVAELFSDETSAVIPHIEVNGSVDSAIPPEVFFSDFVFYEILVFGGSACEYACIDGYSASVSNFAYFEPYVIWVSFGVVEFLERGVMNYLIIPCDSVLRKIDFCHFIKIRIKRYKY